MSPTLTLNQLHTMFVATDDAETDREWRRSIDVSTAQIEALRRKAGEAGDLDMVSICDAALLGHETSLLYVADAIADAAAQR